MTDIALDETLAEEFSRLVIEYNEGERQHRAEAWNLITDFALEHCDAILRALRTSPSQVAPANPAQVMDAVVEHMVQRFLQWEIPANFHPDGGISYEPIGSKGTKYEFERNPHGTNLFDHTQATAMVRYILEGLPAAIGAGGQAVADEDALETVERELIDGLEVEINIGAENYTFNHRQLARRILSAISQPYPADDRVVEAHNYEMFRTFAHEATKAITNLTGGGSEYFGKEVDGVFLADLPRCVDRLRHRIDLAARLATEGRKNG